MLKSFQDFGCRIGRTVIYNNYAFGWNILQHFAYNAFQSSLIIVGGNNYGY